VYWNELKKCTGICAGISVQ